jgi:hypothetical protein
MFAKRRWIKKLSQTSYDGVELVTFFVSLSGKDKCDWLGLVADFGNPHC